MIRRLMLVVAAGAVLFVAPAPSFAVTSTQSGWWTSAPLAAAPDVPEGGILLQGGPTLDQPLAYGAVSFTLSANEQPRTLTLAVAANSATTPNASVTVCALTKPFTPADGGPIADAPAFDCTNKVTATRADDGRTFTLDTANFVRNSAVAVALLPTVLSDRIVLERLAPASLSTSMPSAPTVSPGVGASATGSRTPGLPATRGAPVGSPPLAAAAPVSQPPAAAAAVRAPAAATSAPASDKHSSTVGFAFVALLVLMGALWLFAGTAHDDAGEDVTPAASTSLGGLSA